MDNSNAICFYIGDSELSRNRERAARVLSRTHEKRGTRLPPTLSVTSKLTEGERGGKGIEGKRGNSVRWIHWGTTIEGSEWTDPSLMSLEGPLEGVSFGERVISREFPFG